MKWTIIDGYTKFREYEGVEFFYKFEENFRDKNPALLSAKNDEICFQVLMIDEEEFAFTCGKEPYFTVQGLLPVYRVEVLLEDGDVTAECFPEDFIDDDDGLRYSDILLKTEQKHCAKYQPGILFVKLNVPAGAKTGRHSGRINIYSRVMTDDERLIESKDFSFDVYDYVFSPASEQKFCLDLWQHCSNIARYHEVGLFSDEHFAILKKYVQSLAQLGQKAITVVASDAPWCSQRAYNHITGQSDLFEYAMMRAVRDRNGQFAFDFSPMKRYIDLCMDCGIAEEIDVFGLIGIWQDDFMKLGDIVEGEKGAPRIRYYDEAEGTFRYMRKKEEVELYLEALFRFFSEEGWLEKVRVIADEPAEWDSYLEKKCQLEKLRPNIKYKTAINHAEALKYIAPESTDIAPFILLFGEDADDVIEYKKANENSKVYYYVCGGPLFPNTFILSSLLECRLIPILAEFMNLDGFLRWNYTVWPKDPRSQLHYMFHSGDLNFVYPSRGGDVLLSLRYFALKAGIKEFELLKAVGEETRQKVYDLLIKDKKFYIQLKHKVASECFSLDAKDYAEAKRILLEEAGKKSLQNSK